MRRELIRSVIYKRRDLYIKNANNDFELLHNLGRKNRRNKKGDKRITDATLLRINVRINDERLNVRSYILFRPVSIVEHEREKL